MFNLTGYYPAREFYHLVISEHVKVNILEYRSTVYWDPEVISDKSGLFSFHINRKDISENIKVIIEGMMENGRPVYGVFEFN